MTWQLNAVDYYSWNFEDLKYDETTENGINKAIWGRQRGQTEIVLGSLPLINTSILSLN